MSPATKSPCVHDLSPVPIQIQQRTLDQCGECFVSSPRLVGSKWRHVMPCCGPLACRQSFEGPCQPFPHSRPRTPGQTTTTTELRLPKRHQQVSFLCHQIDTPEPCQGVPFDEGYPIQVQGKRPHVFPRKGGPHDIVLEVRFTPLLVHARHSQRKFGCRGSHNFLSQRLMGGQAGDGKHLALSSVFVVTWHVKLIRVADIVVEFQYRVQVAVVMARWRPNPERKIGCRSRHPPRRLRKKAIKRTSFADSFPRSFSSKR